MLNETHDAKLQSWVTSANLAGTDFPIQNLPMAVCRQQGQTEFSGAVAIGDNVLDLSRLVKKAVLKADAETILKAAAKPSLNDYMALGKPAWSLLRLNLSRLLREDSNQSGLIEDCLYPQSEAEFTLPCRIGDYTDFYTSIHHATRIGKLFRPDNPLLPNYKWIPIGYHGRASSIGISGQEFNRPKGQLKMGDSEPTLSACTRLDYELEMGIYIGPGNTSGSSIEIESAEDQIFGICLLNDWSARDVQAWEYQPLGPFLAKNFATTISPWIVTHEALAPFRSAFTRPEADPPSLPYLNSKFNRESGAMDIDLSCFLISEKMRSEKIEPKQLSASNYKQAYWTSAQLVTHHAINGCNLNSGDLLGTGTQSGEKREQGGCLLELTDGGSMPLELPSGESRTFLEDGDTVIMKGQCQREGWVSIGFGEVCGTVLPSN